MAQITLPYRTDWEPMLDLLDYIKGSGAERARLDARFGGGEPMRETLNALEQLGLIARGDSDEVRLTSIGDEVVYAPDEASRQRVLAELLLGYQPYGIPCERAVSEGKEQIEAPWLEHVWQVDMRLGQPRNRVAEARTCFFRLAEAAGLGRYRRGVRGQASRLELLPTVYEIVAQRESQPSADLIAEEAVEGVEGVGSSEAPTVPAPIPETLAPAMSSMQLTVTADLTDWDLEKIRGFLELLRDFDRQGSLTIHGQSGSPDSSHHK